MKKRKLTTVKGIIGVFILLGIFISACGNSEKEKKIDSYIKALKKEAALYSIVEVPNALTEVGEPAVDPLMDAYKLSLQTKNDNSSDWDIESTFRRAILNTLAGISSKKSVKALIRILENTNEYIQLRSHAAAILGETRSDYAIGALLRALKHEESDIRTGAFSGLEKIESGKAVDALIDVLEGGFDIPVNRTVRALGKIAAKKPGLSRKIVKALINALDHRQSGSMNDICHVLGEIGAEESVEPLAEILSHNDRQVRREAAVALGKIGEKGSVKAVDALIKGLNHKEPDIRFHVVTALGKIDSPKVVETISRALNDIDLGVQTAAFGAMRKIGETSKTENTLIDILENNKDIYVRENAVKALSQSGTANSLDALIRALTNDTSYSVRQEVLRALKKNGSPKAVDGMILALKDQSPFIRGEAVRLLGEIRSDKTLDAIIGALADNDPVVRGNVLDALNRNRSDKAVAAIINLVNDKSKDVNTRAKAVRVLGNMNSIKYVDTLIRALRDQNSYIRSNAAQGLSGLVSGKVEKALVRALKNDSNSGVRYYACVGLERIGTTNAVTAIIHALKDKHYSVQSEAIRALERIAKKEDANSGRALDALIDLLKYGKPVIQHNVSYILERIDNPKAVRAVEQYRLKKKRKNF